MTFKTRFASCGWTLGSWLMVRDTVAVETRARFAISRMFIVAGSFPGLAQGSPAIIRLRRAAVPLLARGHHISPIIVCPILLNRFSAGSGGRRPLQLKSGWCERPEAGNACVHELRIRRQRMRIISRRVHAVIQ